MRQVTAAVSGLSLQVANANCVPAETVRSCTSSDHRKSRGGWVSGLLE